MKNRLFAILAIAVACGMTFVGCRGGACGNCGYYPQGYGQPQYQQPYGQPPAQPTYAPGTFIQPAQPRGFVQPGVQPGVIQPGQVAPVQVQPGAQFGSGTR